MEFRTKRPLAWLGTLVLAIGLAACGGGGGGGASEVVDTPDARNGDYVVFAADARQYTLTLDFDAEVWRLTGNGADTVGTFDASGNDFVFAPTIGAAPPVNNARFSQFGDTVVGGLRLAGALVPFIGSRSFVTTVAEAAGAYKFLTTTLDTAGLPNNFIFTGEIVAPATLRYCIDNAVVTIAACPPGSVATGALTVSGSDFRADFGAAGSFPFRVARVGSDKVFLRASAAAGTTRRFWVGVDQNTAFADVTFSGVNNVIHRTTTTLTAATLSTTLLSEANATTNRTGTVNAGAVPGLVTITTALDGNFFAMRSADLGFVFAARNNPTHPGYVEIGRR
jgi:hypothetical protein